VCRNPVLTGPEALGGGWQCDKNVDVGTAPIPRPQSLMCSTDLSGVMGKTIGIRAFYFTTLIRHANVRSSDSETNAYVEFDGSYIDDSGGRLPPGQYRCRFSVNGKVVRVRSIVIGRVRLARMPLRYHYGLELATAGKPRRAGPTRVGEQFTVVISSKDLSPKTAVKVDLCVNQVHGEACSAFYVLRGRLTSVDWQVDRGEGVGSLYRLSVRVQGREVAHRDLRLIRHS
jgi:hypothetical protein